MTVALGVPRNAEARFGHWHSRVECRRWFACKIGHATGDTL